MSRVRAHAPRARADGQDGPFPVHDFQKRLAVGLLGGSARGSLPCAAPNYAQIAPSPVNIAQVGSTPVETAHFLSNWAEFG